MTLYNDRPQIKIGDKWSFDTWGLLLAQGWELTDVEVKEEYIDIPASDGALDITEVLSGEPKYRNRVLSFGLVFLQPENEWEGLRQRVLNYCSGQRMKIVLPHDLRHYLYGRIRPSGGLERQPGSAVLNFEVTCDPWRYKNRETVVTANVAPGGTFTGNLRNERRRVLPEITTNAACAVTINGVTEAISAGTFKFTDFVLEPGNNLVTVTSTPGAAVTFTYQEASL